MADQKPEPMFSMPNMSGMDAMSAQQKLANERLASINRQFQKKVPPMEKMFKKLGLDVSMKGMLKQSQIFTGTLGAIFQMLGAFIDVMLAPMLPMVVPFIRKMVKAIPTFRKIGEMIRDFVMGFSRVMDKIIPKFIKNLGGATFVKLIVAYLAFIALKGMIRGGGRRLGKGFGKGRGGDLGGRSGGGFRGGGPPSPGSFRDSAYMAQTARNTSRLTSMGFWKRVVGLGGVGLFGATTMGAMPKVNINEPEGGFPSKWNPFPAIPRLLSSWWAAIPRLTSAWWPDILTPNWWKERFGGGDAPGVTTPESAATPAAAAAAAAVVSNVAVVKAIGMNMDDYNFIPKGVSSGSNADADITVDEAAAGNAYGRNMADITAIEGYNFTPTGVSNPSVTAVDTAANLDVGKAIVKLNQGFVGIQNEVLNELSDGSLKTIDTANDARDAIIGKQDDIIDGLTKGTRVTVVALNQMNATALINAEKVVASNAIVASHLADMSAKGGGIIDEVGLAKLGDTAQASRLASFTSAEVRAGAGTKIGTSYGARGGPGGGVSVPQGSFGFSGGGNGNGHRGGGNGNGHRGGNVFDETKGYIPDADIGFRSGIDGGAASSVVSPSASKLSTMWSMTKLATKAVVRVLPIADAVMDTITTQDYAKASREQVEKASGQNVPLINQIGVEGVLAGNAAKDAFIGLLETAAVPLTLLGAGIVTATLIKVDDKLQKEATKAITKLNTVTVPGPPASLTQTTFSPGGDTATEIATINEATQFAQKIAGLTTQLAGDPGQIGTNLVAKADEYIAENLTLGAVKIEETTKALTSFERTIRDSNERWSTTVSRMNTTNTSSLGSYSRASADADSGG